MNIKIPDFRPLPLVLGGHAQTLVAYWFPGVNLPYSANRHTVTLSDGDQIVLHDDIPPDWEHGDRVAVLMHGLAGCHQSAYMKRVTKRLIDKGVRTFRMDLRGCGAGVGLARLPCHSGRSDDTAEVIEYLAQICPDSPVSVVGFSMGGNIALKLLGESGGSPPGNLDSGVAVCPPIDLMQCIRRIQTPPNHFYDRYFVKLLLKLQEATRRLRPDAVTYSSDKRPRGLFDLDQNFTAPVSGFRSAVDYYRRCSGIRFLDSIKLPTLVIAADDDPLIPIEPFREASRSPDVHILESRGGGHLGFLGSMGIGDPDRRWMDWRIVQWIQHHELSRATVPEPEVAAISA